MREQAVQMADFRMIDLAGRMRHVTIPASECTEELFSRGIGFDASNYGYAAVENSDMVFLPDPDSYEIDPFCSVRTAAFTGQVYLLDGTEKQPLNQYPRRIVSAAESYMRVLGIADEMMILPEFEFYLFDGVSWKVSPQEMHSAVYSDSAHWNSDERGKGLIVPRQGNYHAALPFDRTFDLRSEMCLKMQECGIPVKYHHPEVGGAGQFEIETQLGGLSEMADNAVKIKYIVRNVAAKNGLAATFMPKPVFGEAGSGMHLHIQLRKDDKNLFSDDAGYGHLSETALFFIGGLLSHISSLCAWTNPTTNSFKRLVPGFEAPVTAGYAVSNRSAVIRIPGYIRDPELRRIEIRNPDATCNPYFCFAAVLMAGQDGIRNRTDPRGREWGPFDRNLYLLSEEEKSRLQHLPKSLPEALDALEEDNGYLTAGGVFPSSLVETWIRTKRAECAALEQIPNPAEFRSYFTL